MLRLPWAQTTFEKLMRSWCCTEEKMDSDRSWSLRPPSSNQRIPFISFNKKIIFTLSRKDFHLSLLIHGWQTWQTLRGDCPICTHLEFLAFERNSVFCSDCGGVSPLSVFQCIKKGDEQFQVSSQHLRREEKMPLLQDETKKRKRPSQRCRICGERVPLGSGDGEHLCYVQPLPLDREHTQKILFYDFETLVEESQKILCFQDSNFNLKSDIVLVQWKHRKGCLYVKANKVFITAFTKVYARLKNVILPGKSEGESILHRQRQPDLHGVKGGRERRLWKRAPISANWRMNWEGTSSSCLFQQVLNATPTRQGRERACYTLKASHRRDSVGRKSTATTGVRWGGGGIDTPHQNIVEEPARKPVLAADPGWAHEPQPQRVHVYQSVLVKQPCAKLTFHGSWLPPYRLWNTGEALLVFTSSRVNLMLLWQLRLYLFCRSRRMSR